VYAIGKEQVPPPPLLRTLSPIIPKADRLFMYHEAQKYLYIEIVLLYEKQKPTKQL